MCRCPKRLFFMGMEGVRSFQNSEKFYMGDGCRVRRVRSVHGSFIKR